MNENELILPSKKIKTEMTNINELSKGLDNPSSFSCEKQMDLLLNYTDFKCQELENRINFFLTNLKIIVSELDKQKKNETK